MDEISLSKIRTLRKSLGLSMQQFAQTLGVSLITVSLVERGKTPSPLFCYKLIKAFCLSFNGLLFSKKIKAKREEIGLSIPALAKATKTALPTIYSIEKGNPASIRIYLKLAKTLNVSLEDFIEWPLL